MNQSWRASKTPRIARAIAGSLPYFCVALIVWSCGVPEDEHARVVQERDSLRNELDDLRNGPARLLVAAQNALAGQKFEEARDLSRQLIARHPASTQVAEAAPIVDSAERGIADRVAAQVRAQQAIDRARADSLKAQEARLARALASMQRTYDNVREIAWYYDRSIPRVVNAASRVLLYIGKPKYGSPSLRFSIRYVSDDWLFIEGYTIKTDAQTYTIDASGYNDVERDNGYGGIWEWYDVPATAQEIEIARAIIGSKHSVLRHNGKQYHQDRTIGVEEKAALRRVLDAYEVLQRS